VRSPIPIPGWHPVGPDVLRFDDMVIDAEQRVNGRDFYSRLLEYI